MPCQANKHRDLRRSDFMMFQPCLLCPSTSSCIHSRRCRNFQINQVSRSGVMHTLKQTSHASGLYRDTHERSQHRSVVCSTYRHAADGTAGAPLVGGFKLSSDTHKGFSRDNLLPSLSYQRQQQGAEPVRLPRQTAHPGHQLGPQPLLGAHAPLKYAQMGHSNYGRGAPHVCYMQAGSQGLFYSRVDQQQQQPSPSWGRVAQHAMHAAASFLGGSSRGSLLSAAAGASGSSTAAVPPEDYATAQQQAGGSTGSSLQGPDVGVPQWRVLVVQGLVLAAALLVGGVVLKLFFRVVVAALVACYSGLFFKA